MFVHNEFMKKDKVVYIDSDPKYIRLIRSEFRNYYEIFTSSDKLTAFATLKKHSDIKVIIISYALPGLEITSFIKEIQRKHPDIILLLLVAHGNTDVSLLNNIGNCIHRLVYKPWQTCQLKIDIDEAIEKYDFLEFNKSVLISLEQKVIELNALKQQLEDENLYLKTEVKSLKQSEDIITQDKLFLQILQNVNSVANTNAPILLTGETGTGKEVIARAIHEKGNPKTAPFICVNCAAIPETLFESELFGHEKGAFTNATSNQKGAFELAQNGTLFLDEIGEIPLNLQPKLLRAIQDKIIKPLGSSREIHLNIRIICATNRNLESEIEKGNFRSDLYYRISVIPIHLPPLRERVNDIPLLVTHFINKYNSKYNKHVKSILKKSVSSLKTYSWPGNIRELENVIERAVITSPNGELNLEQVFSVSKPSKKNKSFALRDIEKQHLEKVLNLTSWKISGSGGAAELLDLPRSTVQYKIEKHQLKKS